VMTVTEAAARESCWSDFAAVLIGVSRSSSSGSLTCGRSPPVAATANASNVRAMNCFRCLIGCPRGDECSEGGQKIQTRAESAAAVCYLHILRTPIGRDRQVKANENR